MDCSFFFSKVCDSYADGVLDDHDFAETDKRSPDKDVDIFPSGPRELDDAVCFQFENAFERHVLAIELHLDVETQVRISFDFLYWTHVYLSANSGAN